MPWESRLAYRHVDLVGHIFTDAPPLEPTWGAARVGLQTSNDSRFVRKWWEVLPCRLGWDLDWVPFAKGGSFSRFYQSFELVVLWRDSGAEIKRYNNRIYGKGGWSRQVRSEDSYGQAGLTWPRAGGVFNVRWLPSGHIFADKGPGFFPSVRSSEAFLAGVLNSLVADFLIRGLVSRRAMGGRWELGAVKRIPLPLPTPAQKERIGKLATAIRDSKASWDRGNEASGSFKMPWLARRDLFSTGDSDWSLGERLRYLIAFEISAERHIRELLTTLNKQVYRLYGLSETTQCLIEEIVGDRPSEVLWAQMDRKSAEQKRMEHVWRLLSYVTKRVVEADEDGIVPFIPVSGEAPLIDRFHQELATLFPEHDVNQIEVEITNELKRKVKGYRRVTSIGEWFEDVFFQYHVSLYKKRPILWNVASSQGRGTPAFSALVHYHKFDRDRFGKLRGSYLYDAIRNFRREAALAAREGRTEERQEWQARLEEAEELDRRLRWIQEGQNAPQADVDCRILTPWKTEGERPKGWDPDLDDGVAVNIAPLERAGVLRIAKVL